MDCPRAYHTSARPVFRSILTALTPATRSTERCALCTQNGHDNPLMWITASAGPCILAVVAVGLFVVVAQPTANPAAARAATSVVPKRIIWLRSHSCRVSGGTSFRRVPRVAMPATETTGNATINGRCTRSIRTDPRSSEESTPPYAATQTGHEKLANSGSTAVRASARRAAGFSPRLRGTARRCSKRSRPFRRRPSLAFAAARRLGVRVRVLRGLVAEWAPILAHELPG